MTVLAPAHPRPVIVGIPGETVDSETATVLRRLQPAGVILFKRNCVSEEQVAQLTAQLRDFLPGSYSPLIFIDQEGGRVNRLDQPYMGVPAATFGEIYKKDAEVAMRAARLNAFVIAGQLAQVGITADCAPVADVPVSGSHNIIGDRAFSEDPAITSALCGAAISGLLAGGVYPVIKHAPGHGRARADSHLELPVVDAPLDVLQQSDFVPFLAHPRCPFAMTAHILYKDIDPDHCATNSRKVIHYMRQTLGMTSLLMSDDINMKALQGSAMEKAQRALAAGCDLLLHCDGNLDEMAELEALTPMDAVDIARLQALPRLPAVDLDILNQARNEMAEVLAQWA